MPGIQYLGDISQDTGGGYLARALGGGISTGLQAYVAAKEKGKERALETRKIGAVESELDLKEKQLDHDYAKLDYDKRKDMYDTMIKLLPNVPSEKQKELTSSPEWIALEKSLGMPSLSGTTLAPEKPKPSWGQEQETASIKSDLMRGQGSISTLVGEPLPVDIKTEEDALNYISKKGRNPAEFAVELEKYKTTAPIVAVKGKGKEQYRIGQKITKDGKTYTYRGNGKWSY